MAAVKVTRILYGVGDAGAFAHSVVFRRAGYDVSEAVGRKGVQEAAEGAHFDVVVLGHTLSKDDRHHLPYAIKKLNPETRLVVLHASGHHPKVDLVVDSRRGNEIVLQTVAELLLRPVEV